MTGSTLAAKRDATLFAFLRHYHDEIPSEILSAIPEGEHDDVPHAHFNEDLFSASLIKVLSRIHYSWVAQAIASDHPELWPVWCAAIPPGLARGVARVIGLSHPIPSISEPIARFLLQTLYQRLGLIGVLPLALLPPSGLNRLLDLEKRTLVRLFNDMGLYDLAAALRRSVVPAVHQTVLDLLNHDQRIELERALQSQDILPAPDLQLEEWTVDTKQLKRLLQLRGLNRLGRLLAGSDTSLIWHLAHQLDTGRGKLLMSHSQRRLEPEVETRMIDQLDSLLQRVSARPE